MRPRTVIWPRRAITVAKPRSRRSSIRRPGLRAAVPMCPASGRRRSRAEREERLGTKALPGWVVEHGRTDLDESVAVADRIEGAKGLAVALRPAGEEAEADPRPERRGEGDGGQKALVRLRCGRLS